ncbi:hypothetical protein ACIB24_05725 [Spongisporangium articulatum]|uniref:DUF4386 family protein n=1 Tax=Spongisporangium articulatum TaxID=3362603 RepID=A0ABW8AJN7_9ACTN
MSITQAGAHPGDLAPSTQAPAVRYDAGRASTWFGLAFPAAQFTVMLAMAIFVLPHGGAPTDPALERGLSILDAETTYRMGNYVFMLAGVLLLGFLGAVAQRLRAVDASGVLATVGVAAGTLIALIWPMAGMLHDVALSTAAHGTDVRILTGWDDVAPYSLAFSALPRLFLIGALVLGLRAAGTSTWLPRVGVVIGVLSLAGNATTLSGAMFPLLALSTLAFDLWLASVAWHWLRHPLR